MPRGPETPPQIRAPIERVQQHIDTPPDDELPLAEETGYSAAENAPLAVSEEGEDSEDKPKRRRRGRRGRRPRKEEGEGAPAEGAVEGAEQPAAEEEEPAPARRKRGTRGGARKQRVAVSADDAGEETPTKEVAVEDDEEVEDVSSWVIPPWTELIDSLYRPDR